MLINNGVMKIIQMDKKVNIFFTNFFPIGSRALQNCYFIINCPATNCEYRSPVDYGGRPNLSNNGLAYFWSVDLVDSQQQVFCQLLLLNEDRNTKNDQIISSVKLNTTDNSFQQKEANFYQGSRKIGVLIYVTRQIHQHKKVSHNVFNQQTQKQEDLQLSQISKILSKNNQQIQIDYPPDFQNERYRIDFTPQNSFVKMDSDIDMQVSHAFGNLDESMIAKRRPSKNDKSFMADTSLQYKNQHELSSLQKWLKKLKNVESQKKHHTNNIIKIQPQVHEKYLKYLKSNESYDAKLNLKEMRISNKKKYQNAHIKSLSLNVIENDGKRNEQKIFECSFSDSNISQNSLMNNPVVDQIKFQNLTADIPSNKNIEIKMILNGITKKNSLKQISGIFIKEKFLKQFEIPLFGEDEQIFASLGYRAKKIKNVSVQCLPPIQENPFESTNYNEAFSGIALSPQKSSTLNNKIRQRKLNNKVLRRQIQQDFKTKRHSYDQQENIQIALHSLSNPIKINPKANNKNIDVSIFSIKENSQFSSENQFRRSKTDQLASHSEGQNFLKIQKTPSQDISNRHPGINLIHSFLTSSKVSAHDSSPQKSPLKIKNQPLHQRKNTNLTDLQQEQSEEEYSYLNIDKRHQFYYLNSARKNVSFLEKNPKKIKKQISPSRKEKQQNLSRSSFTTEINSITVILYEDLRPDEEQSGKFLILKSDKGETFITQTLFNNHLNLSWKKKSYKFTSTSIEISLYERTGHSAQCQNNHNFNTTIKFPDLMKAIKQNFYRQQIFVNGQAVGTIVLLYDILMQRRQLTDREQNESNMHLKNSIQKMKRNINNLTEMNKQRSSTNQQQSMMKIKDDSQIRRRSKTLNASKNQVIFPSIERKLSRRPKVYEGGRNIKIGRTERFLSCNMAEILGEL